MHIRPRERFLAYGAAALTNEELLALILRSGTKEAAVTDVASDIMHKFERVQQLREATVQELTAIKGIGQMKALQLLAAIELGKRIASKTDVTRYSIRSPADAAEYVMEELSGLQQEHFLVLYLNTKNEVMHKETVFIGSLNASIVHPREIFRHAIKRAAANILIVHNHPSGTLTPSAEDLEVTDRLVEVGKIIGIDVVDHLIIGDYEYLSFKEKGYIV
ncbi:MAG: DNA repair protein RadC [Caryophanon sp.]|nr:DNA repair protein RadC [Caryophanon sp.]